MTVNMAKTTKWLGHNDTVSELGCNFIEICNEGMEYIVLLRIVCQFCIVALDMGHYLALSLIAETIQIRDH
jgi:hypothetical protein